MRNRALLLFLLLALLAGCGAGFGEREPEHVFRYADNQAEDYPTSMAAKYFAELVRERTAGRIVVEVYAGGQLGDELSIIDQLRFGGVDFSRNSLSTLWQFDPVFNVLMLPYLYEDSRHMWKVLDGDIGRDFLAAFENIGVIGLTWFDAGVRSFYIRQKEVQALEDMAGLRIRVQENDMMSRMVELMGASPVQMVYSEVYEALQTRRIDGAENNLPSYQSTAHYQPASYFLQNEHSRIPEAVLMSPRSMEKLSAADADIIRQAAAEAGLRERELWAEYEAKVRRDLTTFGVTMVELPEEEKQRFRAAVEPLYAEFAGEYLDIVENIRAVAGER